MGMGERTAEAHAELVASLQVEYFADDLQPPAAAFTWPEVRLRAWFERGGDATMLSAEVTPELVIPVGEWCGLATIMTALDARRAAFPLDWVYSSTCTLLRLLESDCEPETLLSGALNLRHVLPHNHTSPCLHKWQCATGADADKPTCEATEAELWPVDPTKPQPTTASLNDGDGLQPGCHVQDLCTGVVFPHDFGAGRLDEQFAPVLDKYRRRCARLRATLQGQSVLLMHVRNSQISGEKSPYGERMLWELDRALQRWPRVRLECWNVIDAPPGHVLEVVLGLRLVELSMVGEAGAAGKSAVLHGARQLVQQGPPGASSSQEKQETDGSVAVSEDRSSAHKLVVISLQRRSDRRAAFLQRWQGAPPQISSAVDGAELLRRKSVPLPNDASLSPSAQVHELLGDWRGSMCAHDSQWGAQLPRKLAAVAACHCSHLLQWDALLQSESSEDTVLFIMEDDAILQLPAGLDLASWFEREIMPQLPPDWAFCYLNEPLKCIEAYGHHPRNRPGRATAASSGAGAEAEGWCVIGVDDPSNQAARCVRTIDGVPASEAYALRRSAAARLVEFSVLHGLGAVDYVIAKAFAGPSELAAFPIDQPYLDLIGVPDRGRQTEQRAMATGAVSMAGRVFLVDPPVVRQAYGTSDSDIQNFVLVEGHEAHMSEFFKASVDPCSPQT